MQKTVGIIQTIRPLIEKAMQTAGWSAGAAAAGQTQPTEDHCCFLTGEAVASTRCYCTVRLESVAKTLGAAFDVESFINEYYGAWSGTDEDLIMSYYSENVLLQIPGAGNAREGSRFRSIRSAVHHRVPRKPPHCEERGSWTRRGRRRI